MKTAHELKAWLEQFNLLHAVTPTDDAIDEMLDARDRSDFETDYLRLLSIVPDEEELLLSDDDVALNAAISRLAFNKARAFADSELASYVADDFDLLARALQGKIDDSWLDKFFEQYKLGLFPCGKLK